jgi:Holliday junction resolvasome RuvABC endonuclease subunit
MTTVLGLQCEKERMLWALIDGETRGTATMVSSGSRPLPKKSRQERLHWIFREVAEMVHSHSPGSIHLNEAEAGQSMKASTLERAQMDGVVLAAAEQAQQVILTYKWPGLRSRYKLGSKDLILDHVSTFQVAMETPRSRLVPVIVALAELPE